MPAHSQISFPGFTDHHIAEVLLSVLAYMFFIIVIFYLWTPWLQTITPAPRSYFQLLYVLISATAVIFLGIISCVMKNQKWYFYPVLIVILTVFLFLTLTTIFSSFYESLLNGIGYLLRDAPVLKQISEAQPLFYTFFA